LEAADTTALPSGKKPMSKNAALGLMLICTVLSAIGQILIKMGANTLGAHASPLAMLSNVPLVAGYGLYGIMTVLFIFALRDQELSILFPIISLSYVWVAGLSVWAFHDHLNAPRVAGIAIIIAGVFVLGKEGHK